ncbi:DUF4222 domain-containing protein [Salmonella enterica]|nr:DUF4222 domain-containing protein [Salmonella enterica]ECQ6334714.1 DUF4222 domain-containing protein [Salmonella enterica subsp. enterica serovar Abony]ECZ0087354.1 DUF4222 domain-containing protein [Salmonella enterica subsp. enterica serovar Miami]EGB5718850.1 DUF4222 domain-containing protein [Salmonella enterica subsp. enterica serovar Abony]EHA9695764.1 DUF4222 domain-containing protein [Salmonella enterica subsp. enterica serovar Abony]
MTIKNPGLTAGGRAHSEIRPGDKWKDKRGCLVTVESYRFNRVTFYRDGYASPCVQSDLRFLREFKRVEESQ